MSWPDFGRLPKELATVGPSWLTSDHYFEAELERPVCRQVVAGPRFEPATEAPANGFHGRPVDHCFSAHGARNSTPELARFLTSQAKDTSAILAGIPHGYL